jgi:hypothetical protein
LLLLFEAERDGGEELEAAGALAGEAAEVREAAAPSIMSFCCCCCCAESWSCEDAARLSLEDESKLLFESCAVQY